MHEGSNSVSVSPVIPRCCTHSKPKISERYPTLFILNLTKQNVSIKYVFLYYHLGQDTPELLPVFLAPLENHTVTQGRDVFFTCVVNHLHSFKVAWIKSDSRAILAIHTHMVTHNPRLSVTHNGHDTWKLHIANVQKNDSGTYMCQINTDPMRSQVRNQTIYF